MILESLHADWMMSLEPHYCDLVLLDKPWSGLGFLTSLFIHQADQSLNFDLREESYWLLSLNTDWISLPPLTWPEGA